MAITHSRTLLLATALLLSFLTLTVQAVDHFDSNPLASKESTDDDFVSTDSLMASAGDDFAAAAGDDLVFQEPYEIDDQRHEKRDAHYYATCTLRQVENICARNVTMELDKGQVVKAPGVSVWIQAHCKDVVEEAAHAKCVLSYIADDFGDEQANEFFACVCDECPRACVRGGNLRTPQNLIAKETANALGDE